ncbi:hypothetical protein COB11_01545 [Candidatus Aerophobetes bacterium]|uniref:USP domain-containing protein n=1 Tax=Aerophobetes bacterium TaxID=2030807 RepID=A0A2A4YLH4_UNCAE|nr:MAG: hypothetical protein COB11_01545 [Candidatus Aerophobetes bacterium]
MTLNASLNLRIHSEALITELLACINDTSTKGSVTSKKLLELVTPCLADIAVIEKRKGLAKKTPPILIESYRKLRAAEVIVHMEPRKNKFPAGYQGLLNAIEKIQTIAQNRLYTTFLTEQEAKELENDYVSCKENLEGYIKTKDLAPLADIARENIALTKDVIKLLSDDDKTATLSSLIATLEKKLKVFSAKAIKKNGSTNVGGNDCFLNACYQFFKTKELQDHFVRNLPKELWEIFATSEPNSALMRKRLVEQTGFGQAVRSNWLDPYTAQLDSTEVLNHLFPRLYAEDNSYKPPTVEEIEERTLVKRDGRKKSYLLIYIFMKTFDQISRACSYIAHSYFVRCLFGTEGGIEYHPSLAHAIVNPASISQERKSAWAQRTLLPAGQMIEDQGNPLYFKTKLRIEYTPDQDVPDVHADAAHEMWQVAKAGDVGLSIKIDDDPYLPLKLVKSGDAYQLNEIFRHHFQEENAISTLTRGDRVYTAQMKKTFTLQDSPEGFMLSFSRAVKNEAGQDVKITDPIKGIESTLKIAADLTEDQAEKHYELRSFMTHRGTRASGGHMVAYRKEKDGDDGQEAWFIYNDSTVTKVANEAEALKAAERSYVLFYRKASS